MTTAITSIIVFVVAGVALVLVWRTVRFIMRLALIGVLILALLVGALAWWYATSGSTSPPEQSRPTNKRRASSK